MKRSLNEIAELVGARLVGDGAIEVRGVASIHSAGIPDLVFVEEAKLLREGRGISSSRRHQPETPPRPHPPSRC